VRIWAGSLLMLKGFQFLAVLAVLGCSRCSGVLVCARSRRGVQGGIDAHFPRNQGNEKGEKGGWPSDTTMFVSTTSRSAIIDAPTVVRGPP